MQSPKLLQQFLTSQQQLPEFKRFIENEAK